MASVETILSGPVLPGPLDFYVSTHLAAPIGSGGSGDLVAVGTGTGTVAIVTGEPGHPGIRAFSTGASATGNYYLGSVAAGLVLTGMRMMRTRFVGRIPVLSTPAQRFTCYHGFFDNVSSSPGEGVFWRYTDNLGGGLWELQVRVGGLDTLVSAGVGPVANEWFASEIVTVNGRVWSASIQGVNVDVSPLANAAFTTAAGIIGVNIRKTVGANALTLHGDYFDYGFSL